VLPDPLTGFRGPTSKGREGWKGENRYKEEGKRDEEEREGWEWKKRSREEREGREKRRCAAGIFNYFRLWLFAFRFYCKLVCAVSDVLRAGVCRGRSM